MNEPSEFGPDLHKKLLAIWRRLFNREDVGQNDNFFDLGGDPKRASELFRHIRTELGQWLAPVVIYQAPTVASLAAILANPNPPPFPEAVLLKAGENKLPVFLTHGLGGNLLEFFNLVQHLDTGQAVYGLQARGSDGLHEPCTTIEEMAAFHTNAIRSIQPRGPYVLIGYSLGGLVALEMARQFSDEGDEIALLIMIDSYPPLALAPAGQRITVQLRRLQSRARSAFGLPAAAPAKAEELTVAMQRIREASAGALENYKPRAYHGNIRFLRAETPINFPKDPTLVWSNWLTALKVDTIPGDHHSMLTTHYGALAAAISRYLSDLNLQSLSLRDNP